MMHTVCNDIIIITVFTIWFIDNGVYNVDSIILIIVSTIWFIDNGGILMLHGL